MGVANQGCQSGVWVKMLCAKLTYVLADNLGDIKDQQAVTRLYNEYMELLMLNTAGNYYYMHLIAISSYTFV